MSETLKVLETRRSCRAFKPELIEEEKLQAIIKAGTYAATGMGRPEPPHAVRDAASTQLRTIPASVFLMFVSFFPRFRFMLLL